VMSVDLTLKNIHETGKQKRSAQHTLFLMKEGGKGGVIQDSPNPWGGVRKLIIHVTRSLTKEVNLLLKEKKKKLEKEKQPAAPQGYSQSHEKRNSWELENGGCSLLK